RIALISLSLSLSFGCPRAEDAGSRAFLPGAPTLGSPSIRTRGAVAVKRRRGRGSRGRGRVGGRRRAPRGVRRLAWVSPRPPPHRVGVSPPRASPPLSTGAFGLCPPRPVRSWGDDASVEVDQAHSVRRLVGDHQPAVASRLAVALRDEEREPHERVGLDL